MPLFKQGGVSCYRSKFHSEINKIWTTLFAFYPSLQIVNFDPETFDFDFCWNNGTDDKPVCVYHIQYSKDYDTQPLPKRSHLIVGYLSFWGVDNISR